VICAKRSSTPATPKSGEQLDQIAPRLVVANMAITASEQFGKKPTTRSPGTTPAEWSDEAQAATSARRSEKESVERGPSSVQEIKAGRLAS
jgi:hypothetical protein